MCVCFFFQVINQTGVGVARETPDYRLVSDKSFYGIINGDCLLVEEAMVMVSFLFLPPFPIICLSHSSLVRYGTSLRILLFDLYFFFKLNICTVCILSLRSSRFGIGLHLGIRLEMVKMLELVKRLSVGILSSLV